MAAEKKKKWAIMAYIAADDILSDFAVGSLQQLRRVASQDAKVVVAAQFDPNGKQNIPRLIFKGVQDNSQSIHTSKKDSVAANTNMVEPRSLTSFINWAYAECPADHYCLVLWGHGPELLAADYPDLPDGQKAKRFLTPLDVKKGVAESDLIKVDKRKFEIVAVDACNMSMLELACEIADCAEFLVASEEDVPDFSFPYDRLLLLGQSTSRKEIARACRELPKRYIDAYEDYILTQATQTESITLSSLSLRNTGTVTTPLRQLADAFLAIQDKKKQQAIMNARANSQAFVAGLYVDLYDFCDRLLRELDARRINDPALISACQKICDAIRPRNNDAFVMANKVSINEHCHGVCIYFPYLTDLEKKTTQDRDGVNVRRPDGSEDRGGIGTRTRGGIEFPNRGGMDARNQSDRTANTRGDTDARNRGFIGALNKGFIGALNKGFIGALNKERRQRIEETEQYYPQLRLSAETGWGKFIRHCWSRWLVEDAEEKARQTQGTETSEILNQRYSAQQSALNLLSLCRELEKDSTGKCRAGGEQSLDDGKRVPVNRGFR